MSTKGNVMSKTVEVAPPSGSDSSRTVVLRTMPGGVVQVAVREVTMLGRTEAVACMVPFVDLVEAVTVLGAARSINEGETK